MKFRKKPVVIDAVLWESSCESWDSIHAMGDVSWSPGPLGGTTFFLTTLSGDVLIQKGDWIIRGVTGEFYPCKPDVFEMTYEPAEEEA